VLYMGYFNWLQTLNYKSQATGLDVHVDIELIIYIYKQTVEILSLIFFLVVKSLLRLIQLERYSLNNKMRIAKVG